MRSRSAGAAALKVSAPAEAGRPLLEKGGDTLVVVLAEARLALQVALQIQLRVEVVGARPVERTLGEAERARRALGEPGGEAARLGHQRIVGHRFPDQPPRRGLDRR